MRVLLSLLLLVPLSFGQQNRTVAQENANLPAQPVGPNDLVSITVYGSPELTRTARVGADGFFRLPMVKQRIKAEGLYPSDLETSITRALEEEQILVDPFVTVTIAEYHSRPISVVGAVKMPLTFQAEGPTTVLEAIARAQGLSDKAGQEILVTQMQPGADGKPASLIRHIPVSGLIDNGDPSLNLPLTGGEEIRVPEAAKIYVLGNVKMPNAYQVQNGSETTVLQILALAQGLMPYAGKVAFIYRPDGAGNKKEIAVPLNQIMQRKAADVPLLANDIFYVTDRKGTRMSLTALDRITGLGAAATSALIYTLK